MKPSMKMNAVVDFCTRVIARCQVAFQRSFAFTSSILSIPQYLKDLLIHLIILFPFPYSVVYPFIKTSKAKNLNLKEDYLLNILNDAEYYGALTLQGGKLHTMRRGSFYCTMIKLFKLFHFFSWLVFLGSTVWTVFPASTELEGAITKEIALYSKYVTAAFVILCGIDLVLLKIPTYTILEHFPNLVLRTTDKESGPDESGGTQSPSSKDVTLQTIPTSSGARFRKLATKQS